MSCVDKYKNFSILEIYPPPPSPPLRTDSYRANKEIDREYEEITSAWRIGFKDWQKRREDDKIDNRFEILDL